MQKRLLLFVLLLATAKAEKIQKYTNLSLNGITTWIIGEIGNSWHIQSDAKIRYLNGTVVQVSRVKTIGQNVHDIACTQYSFAESSGKKLIRSDFGGQINLKDPNIYIPKLDIFEAKAAFQSLECSAYVNSSSRKRTSIDFSSGIYSPKDIPAISFKRYRLEGHWAITLVPRE